MGLLEEMLKEAGVQPPAINAPIGEIPLANIGGFPRGTGPSVPVPPTVPPQQPEPQQRPFKEVVSDFAGNFLFSLSQALKGSASAPGQRGTMLGVASALEAPMLQQQMQAQQAAERQKMAMEMEQLKIERERMQNDATNKSAMQQVAILEAATARMKERREAEEADRKAKAPIEISPDATLFDPVSREPIFTAPKTQAPTERNQQFRDVERKGRIIRQYFEGSDPSTVTFEVDTGSVKDRTDDPLSAYQKNQTFLNISNRYQADAIVNQSLKGQTAKAIADQVIANPDKATNQLKSLYVFVKNLDADSAVREGEVALAQLTQSYFQKFGTALARVSEGQILSPAAAKELAEATKELVSTWEKTAKTRTQQYKSQAGVAGVGPQFNQYLTGFERVTGSGAEEVIPGVGTFRTNPDGSKTRIK